MASRCAIDEQRGDLLSELTTGFEALLEKVEELAVRNLEFERQLKTFKAEGRTQFTPTKGSFATSDTQDGETGSFEATVILEEDPRIAKGIQAWELLRMSMTGTVPLRRRRWRKISPNRTPVGPRPGLERDFTTEGRQGQLKCPFSAKPPDLEESHNIAEETGAAKRLAPVALPNGALAASSRSDCVVSKSTSNNESVPKCPIRFLDQMPAEEVARYFEEHKHEIPRSHEVCVKRYQANEQSIRSLDAKYGNLVNMIQGLGQKHQPMLPSDNGLEDEDEAVELDRKSIEKVEKWAENCAEGPGPVEDDIDADDASEARTGHFDRPLPEVRLGESPSRPWGVHVPYDATAAMSTGIHGTENAAAPIQPSTQKDTIPGSPKRPTGSCPFGHGALKPPLQPESTAEAPKRSEPQQRKEPSYFTIPADRVDDDQGLGKDPRQIVFNGPVFFGYSAEDAAALLQSFQRL